MDQQVSLIEFLQSLKMYSWRVRKEVVYRNILVTNVISDGSNGADDLYMTYIFEWKHPEIDAESAEVKDLLAKHRAMAKMAVDKSIESIRKFVKEGVIH